MGKDAKGLGQDRIRTFVSMATESSDMGYNGETLVSTQVPPIFIQFSSFLLETKISDGFEIQQDPISECGVK